MKSLIHAATLIVAVTVPLASFAQSEQPVTRAEVKAQLKQLEQAGYNPAVATDAVYPADIQAAEARVSARNNAAAAYGPSTTGSSETGSGVPAGNPNLQGQ